MVNLSDLPSFKDGRGDFKRICRVGNGFALHVNVSYVARVTTMVTPKRIYGVVNVSVNGEARDERFASDNWFCSEECLKISVCLSGLLGKLNFTSLDDVSWTILRSRGEDDAVDASVSKTKSKEHKLLQAINVLHECFEPVIEPQTQSDLVKDVVFSRRSLLKRLNFKGFYTMILRKGDKLVTVATIRIFGGKVAEMSFIGTRFKYRRQRSLVERLLKIQKKEDAKGIRFRYLSPEGNIYYSLLKICREIKKKQERVNSSCGYEEIPRKHNLSTTSKSLAKRGSPSFMGYVVVEPEYCPQAVVELSAFEFMYGKVTEGNSNIDLKALRLKAKIQAYLQLLYQVQNIKMLEQFKNRSGDFKKCSLQKVAQTI